MQHSKNILKLVFWSAIIRIVLSFSVGLGNDEVYYRMYADHLELNYFDHPPMVGWLIRMLTFNLNFDMPFFIRLTSILSGTATTLLIYQIGKKWKNEDTGFIAAWIYSVTIYGAIIAGTFILPDSPQVFFWSLGLYCLIQILDGKTEKNKQDKWMLLFGIANGLGLLCKVHMIFLWGGFGLYVIFHDRKWLGRWSIYTAAILTLFMFYPVIHWNLEYDFITYRFHSNRVNNTSQGFRIDTLIPFILGQFFYTQFLLFPFFIAAIAKSIPDFKRLSKTRLILLYSSLPLILVSLFLSCFNTVLPHWTGPSYIAISLITANHYLEFGKKEKLMKWIGASTKLTILLLLLAVLLINLYPGTLGKKGNADLGSGDFTLDMYGWQQSKNAVDSVLQMDKSTNRMKGNPFFISHKWFPAAHIDYYICKPLKQEMLVLGDTMDIHQYAWINNYRQKPLANDDAYALIPSNYFDDPYLRWGNQFERIEPADTIPINRSGVCVKRMLLYRLHGYKLK